MIDYILDLFSSKEKLKGAWILFFVLLGFTFWHPTMVKSPVEQDVVVSNPTNCEVEKGLIPTSYDFKCSDEEKAGTFEVSATDFGDFKADGEKTKAVEGRRLLTNNNVLFVVDNVQKEEDANERWTVTVDVYKLQSYDVIHDVSFLTAALMTLIYSVLWVSREEELI